MKLRILLVALFLLGTINIAQAQVSGYDAKIKAAVEAGDYDKAAELKEKKAIKIKIDAAVEAGDYDKASQLKQQLNGEAVSKTKPVITAPKEAPSVEQKSATVVNKIESEKTIKERRSRLLKNGLNIELLIGSLRDNYSRNFGASFRIGTTWYFGSSKIWKPGVRLNFIRFGAYKGSDMLYNIDDGEYILDEYSWVLITPASVGFANVIEFGKNIGLEANLNFGASLIGKNSDYTGSTYFGVLINPEIKFRLGVLAVGLDYTFGRLRSSNNEDYREGYQYLVRDRLYTNILSLSIGAKF